MVRLLNAIIKGLGYVLRVMLIVTVALICVQVFWRYALGSPLTWTEQLCRFIFIWMMMLGIPVLFHKKSFMAFDLLLNALPDRRREIVTLFIDIAICVFAAFWLVGTVQLCAGTMNKLTSGVRIHYYWLYGAQAVSSALILWVMGTQTVQCFRQLASGGKKGGKQP